MENRTLTAFLLASALCGTACGGAKQVREDKKQCQIQWHDYATGKRGETEFMPKAEVVKRIKAIKKLPGFGKTQTDQWVYCK